MKIFKAGKKLVFNVGKMALIIGLQKPTKLTIRFVKNTDALLSI